MKFPGFIGGSYIHRGVTFDCQRALNLYPEASGSGTSKNVGALIGTPGISVFCLLPTAPVRGLWAGDGRLFAASGSKLYELFPFVVSTNGTAVTWVSGYYKFASWMAGLSVTINKVQYTVSSVTNDEALVLSTSAGVQASVALNAAKLLGEIGDDATHSPVRMWASAPGDANRGSQLMIVSAGNVYVHDGLVITQPNLDGDPAYPVTAKMGAYIDGYGIVEVPDTNNVRISQLFDFKNWDSLDYEVKSGAPDRLLAIWADHQELWLFGYETTEVWQNTGNDGDFPFQRSRTGVIQQGICAPWSVGSLNNGVVWIGEDIQGRGVAWRAQGYAPVRISTHAVEQAWASYTTIQDAEGYTYTDEGHFFWVLNFPTAGKTWVYDATTNLWHERAYGAAARQRQHCHAFTWQKHYVGDWENGNIYEQSLDILDDSGSAIYRIRTCPHLSDEGKKTYYHEFQLDMETGTGNAAEPDPLMYLDWSNDGGRKWFTPPDTAKRAGRANDTTRRVTWNRLGSSDARVFRLTSTAKIKHVWNNAYLDATPGKS